ncbi:MAG: serine hydrolase family protein [Candidatus Aenigmarchaeota archaeon]|nr:serine hydrolase family protein [Candidatus Aenigmarchaeota archaeon]
MPNVIIIHGSYGHPEENWFPWLKSELERLGCNVFIPRFPTPDGQTLENWIKTFKGYEKYLDKNSIAVGHSLGPAFLLSVIEKLGGPIKAAFFVAGFIGKFEDAWANPEFDRINRTFAEKQFNWKKIRQNCGKFYVIYSNDDPYVPPEKSEELGKLLDVKPVLIKNAGHFNEKAGYVKFESLLGMLRKEI